MFFGLAALLFQVATPNPPRSAPIAGPQWTVLDTPGGTVEAIAADSTVPSRIYAGLHAGGPGIQRSDDYGVTWQVLEASVRPIRFVADPSDSSRIYAVSEELEIWRSDEAGTHWIRVDGPIGFSGGLVVDAGGILYAGSTSAVFKSPDYGRSGMPTSAIPGASGSSPVAVVPLTADPFLPGDLYVGVQESFTAQLFRTPDGGASWLPIWRANLLEEIVGVAIDRNFPATIYLGLSLEQRLFLFGRVFSSRDRGGSWQEIFTPVGVGSIVPDPVRANTVYVSTPPAPYSQAAVYRIDADRVTRLGGVGFFARKLATSADGSFLYAIDEESRVARLSLVSSTQHTILLPHR